MHTHACRMHACMQDRHVCMACSHWTHTCFGMHAWSAAHARWKAVSAEIPPAGASVGTDQRAAPARRRTPSASPGCGRPISPRTTSGSQWRCNRSTRRWGFHQPRPQRLHQPRTTAHNRSTTPAEHLRSELPSPSSMHVPRLCVPYVSWRTIVCYVFCCGGRRRTLRPSLRAATRWTWLRSEGGSWTSARGSQGSSSCVELFWPARGRG